MLRSLLKGVSMGAGMGIGQEVAESIVQMVRGRKQAGGSFDRPDIQCGGCGEINTGDSKFCGSCGNSFVRKYDIQQGIGCACGYVNAGGQRFCSECGASLG